MPSLFNKRSRSVSTSVCFEAAYTFAVPCIACEKINLLTYNQRPTTPASSSAHLAAAQAFLKNQPSNSALSASAAATALRTMSPPPTSVDQVQTRRMLNRQASNSSVASAAQRGRSKTAVQRRPSTGSMTERTFRSPSPGQQGSVPGVGRGAPPVPAVPHTYSEALPPVPSKVHTRSASVDTPPRVTLPPITRSAGRGQLASPKPSVNTAAAAAARRSTKPQQAPPLQRSDSQESRNSINFSYPRGSRPNSPPPRSPLATNGEGPVNGISAAEMTQIQNQLTQVAAKPVKAKKKKIDPSMIEGSHLQSGTMGSKPVVTPLEPLPVDYEPPVEAQPLRKTKKKAALTGQSSHFPSHEDPSLESSMASDSDTSPDDVRDRRAQRAAGVLMKHPSVVREDWEGEQEEQHSSPVSATVNEMVTVPSNKVESPTQLKKPIPEANMSRKIEDPANMTKTVSSVQPAAASSSAVTREPSMALSPASVEAPVGRGVSISPSRSTRFSDRLASDLVSGRKHEPLGRSVSPAKSALKHFSTGSDGSPTDSKFPQRRGSSVTPSEASDVSVDAATGRKKSARVSFEGVSDAKDAGDIKPSRETNKKSAFGFGKSKSSNVVATSTKDAVDEGMKPRPALPSFGSVRRNEGPTSSNVKAETSADTTVKTPSSSETSSIVDPPTMDTSISSDHALGGLISRETYNSTTDRVKSNEPLPPQVTSVEGTGYASDTDSVYSEDEKPSRAAQAASQQLSHVTGTKGGVPVYNDEIPVIAVQPATPGLDEVAHGREWTAEVPGGFPSSDAGSDISLRDDVYKQTAPATPVREPSGLGLAATKDYSSPPVSADSSPQPLTTIEEDSDENSVYSDAAEDLSDLEGDGFGSINAIVESPIVSPPSHKFSAVSESPLAAAGQKRPVEVQRSTSWEDTQAHWSGLAQQLKDNSSTPPVTPPVSVDANKFASESFAEGPVKAQKTKSHRIPMTTAPLPEPAPTPGPKTQPPRQALSRVSDHPTAATQVVATKRMSQPKSQGQLKSSMRGDQGSAIAQAKQRPVSYTGPPSAPPKGALQKKNLPSAAAAAAAPAPAPKNITRRFSNDSDSDSSFKKARRDRKPADGRYTMKRSMRSGPPEPDLPPAPAGRGGVRSLSPALDRRPVSPVASKTMRMTMRGSIDAGTPTLRGQPEAKRASSLFSRNRTAKSPPRPSTSGGLSSKIKSRVADSDDEDDSRPVHYQSRFAESSDEDEPEAFRPVRGIPRKKDEADSTDLDDSSDDQARRSKAVTTKKPAIVPPPPTQEVVSPPASPTTAKRRSLWGRLRKKKEEDGQPAPTIPAAPQQDTEQGLETGKEESKNAKNLGFNSPAERDAVIEQTRLKLEGAKERPQSPSGQLGSPGRLQRRITPQRVFSDSWAPPKMPAVQENRPQTSDGIDEVPRPTVGSRQPTSEKVNGDGAVYGKSGKKKKFGFLRRAFGLTD